MALLSATLKDELVAAFDDMTAPGSPDANLRLSQAFGEYFKGATVSGATAVSSVVDTAVLAMAGALVFEAEGTPDSAASAFQAALTAFWASIQGAAATCWPGSLPGTAPTTLSTISSLMPAVFTANNAQGVTKDDAAQNLATFLHSTAGIGGTVTISLAPVPIL